MEGGEPWDRTKGLQWIPAEDPLDPLTRVSVREDPYRVGGSLHPFYRQHRGRIPIPTEWDDPYRGSERSCFSLSSLAAAMEADQDSTLTQGPTRSRIRSRIRPRIRPRIRSRIRSRIRRAHPTTLPPHRPPSASSWGWARRRRSRRCRVPANRSGNSRVVCVCMCMCLQELCSQEMFQICSAEMCDCMANQCYSEARKVLSAFLKYLWPTPGEPLRAIEGH